MDINLQDDTLKVVRYSVLFVKPLCEHAFPEREEFVSDITLKDFTASKMAEFIQELISGQFPVPRNWIEVDYPPSEYVKNGYLTGLPYQDKKYLQIHCEVLKAYPRDYLDCA